MADKHRTTRENGENWKHLPKDTRCKRRNHGSFKIHFHKGQTYQYGRGRRG